MKHLMELNLCALEEIGVALEVLGKLTLCGGSKRDLEGVLSCFSFSFPFYELV